MGTRSIRLLCTTYSISFNAIYMNRTIHAFLFLAVALSIAGLAGCSEGGPSASPDQMAASRDSQLKSMGSQRGQSPLDRGGSSIDAAAKAGGKGHGQ